MVMQRTDGLIVLPAVCPACGKARTTYRVSVYERIDPGLVGFCVRCIARMLCRAAIALHGDIADSPASNGHHGHEQRMRDYQRRFAGVGAGTI